MASVTSGSTPGSRLDIPLREGGGHEEADGAEERAEVRPFDVPQIAGRGEDVRADGREAEGDRTDHGEDRAVPRAGERIPQLAAAVRGDEGEGARDEERDRAPGIRSPSGELLRRRGRRLDEHGRSA